MSLHLQTQNVGNQYIDEVPNECPKCHHAMEPQPLVLWANGDPNATKTELQYAFRCGRRLCQEMFIAYYGGEGQGLRSGEWKLQRVAPVTPTPPTFPPDVKSISPQFDRIFSQANSAEAYQLDEIAGVGYRKALEFLVKDYCVNRSPDDAEVILGKPLGRVIADHIDDSLIKQCALRAVWLGNDETHYVRKWDTKDIDDLKALIALTVSWINTHLLTAHYLNEMPQ